MIRIRDDALLERCAAQPAKPVWVPTPAPSHGKRPALLGTCDGFQAHAATSVPPNSPQQLERLLRDVGPPALPRRRIERRIDGTPFSNHSVFKPQRLQTTASSNHSVFKPQRLQTQTPPTRSHRVSLRARRVTRPHGAPYPPPKEQQNPTRRPPLPHIVPSRIRPSRASRCHLHSPRRARNACLGPTDSRACSSKTDWPARAEAASVSLQSSSNPMSSSPSPLRSSWATNFPPALHQSEAHPYRTDHDRHLRPNPWRHPAATRDGHQNPTEGRHSSVTLPPVPPKLPTACSPHL
jgi:hypothetical protein